MSGNLDMNVLAVLRTAESDAELRRSWTGMNGSKVDIVRCAVAELAAKGRAAEGRDAVLLEMDLSAEGEIAALGTLLTGALAGTPIIVAAQDATVSDIRRLMHLGVVDVIPRPITNEDLAPALRQAERLRTRAHPAVAGGGGGSRTGGEVVAFLKCGGGAGATTLAVQSALLMADGRKVSPAEVCLMDLDVQFGMAGLYLDVTSSMGLPEIIEAPGRLDGALLRSLMAHHANGVDVLAAPEQMMALDALTPETMEACLKVARAEYRFVVLDMPQAWTAWSFATLQNVDRIYLVTQLCVSGLHQAKRQMDMLRAEGFPESMIKYVVNRDDGGRNSAVKPDDAEKALDCKLDLRIPNDFKTVRQASDCGQALAQVRRKSPVEKALRAMLTSTVPGFAEESAGKQSFFGFKLFS